MRGPCTYMYMCKEEGRKEKKHARKRGVWEKEVSRRGETCKG